MGDAAQPTQPGVGAVKTTLVRNSWRRKALALLSVPALAGPSAVGVYRYLAPESGTIAAASAAIGFEVLYLGANILIIRTGKLRSYARNVSLAAVATAIIFNTLAHYAAKVPGGLEGAPFNTLAGVLALVVSVPLAGLAYAVSVLLHQLSEDEAQAAEVGVQAMSAPSARASLPVLTQPTTASQLGMPTALTAPTADALQPTTKGWNAVDGYRCPRCGAPISQAMYAASQRWGDKWGGCRQCRPAK
jgi:hypothetical protein